MLIALILITSLQSQGNFTMIGLPETQEYTGTIDGGMPSCVRGPYLQIGTPYSIIIRWRTDIPTDSRLRYGIDSTSLNQRVDSLSLLTEHEVTLTDLSPNTKYFYSVETTMEALSSDSDHCFVTAPPIGTKQKVHIWILGDSGTANNSAASVRDAYYNLSDDTNTDFWVMLGDNAYHNGTDMEYQAAVFNMYTNMLKKSVLWPAFGNHDGHSANSNTQTGVFYDIFSLPSNAEAGGIASNTEAYYSFDYANIHFICLNSHDIDRSCTGAMYSWLQDDLSATAQEWVVAFWHHPAYTRGSHNSDLDVQLIEMRENMLPVLEQGGTDLVFYGHSHAYERSYLIDGHYGFSSELRVDEMILDNGDGQKDGDGAYIKPSAHLSPHEGTIYFTAGSSGQISGGSLDHPVMYISHNKLGSVILDIEGFRADITFLDNNGDSLDYLSLFKGPPIWTDIPDTSFYEDSYLYLNLNDYIYDDGDLNSTLSISIEGGDQIINYIDNLTHIINFSSAPNTNGFTETFIIAATDPWGAIDVDTFSVSVLEALNTNKFILPIEYVLYSAFPNPFNPVTVFKYAVPEQGQMSISIHNLLGRELVQLYKGNQLPGYYSIIWDASGYSNGTYFIKMLAGDYISTQKLMLVK